MTEEERNEEARLFRQYFCDEAIKATNAALTLTTLLGLDAAVWDLQAARRRVEEAREKADG